MIGMLAALLAGAIGAPAPGARTGVQAEDFTDQIILSASGDPATCNAWNARPIALADAVAGRGVTRGDCLALTAYWKGRALFASSADADAPASMVARRLARRRLGLYGSERLLDLAPQRPRPSTIIGSYAVCRTEWPGALMVSGYCHFSDGPFLKMTSASPAERHAIR